MPHGPYEQPSTINRLNAYIVSMLVMRNNVLGGKTTITDNHGTVLWHRTLRRPLDIVIGQDAQTLHAVTPVTPEDPSLPAWRDVLVVAFTKDAR